MASLRDTVKDYQDELRDGIAWVAFWKQGRSWNAEYFHLDMDDTLYPEDRSRGFPFPKSPTGTGRILTPMYLTGA